MPGRSQQACFFLLLGSTARAQTHTCAVPTPSVSSSALPIDVSNQLDDCSNAINIFDDFSWRSFVALIWPAAQGQRGVPDPAQTNFQATGPVVFGTYKTDWETFPPPDSSNPPQAPSPWASFAGTANPCGSSVSIGWGELVLASYTKFGNLRAGGFWRILHRTCHLQRICSEPNATSVPALPSLLQQDGARPNSRA